MTIQGDPRATPFFVQALLEHECQFFLTHKNGKKLRVAFHEGMWKLMRQDGEFFVFYDVGDIQECDNDVLRAFIEQRMKAREKQAGNPYRTYPALVMLDTLAVWMGKLEDVTEISVTQASRDGWFKSFND